MEIFHSCSIFPLTTLVIHSLRATMVSTRGNLKWVFWIGSHVYGTLKKMNTGDTLRTVGPREIFMEFLLGEKSFLMEFCMLQENHIIQFLKHHECIEWNVLRLTLLSLVKLIAQISRTSFFLTQINPQLLMLTLATVKGAVDDLDLVIHTLEECGYSHNRFYIHCDGALFGLMMPFVKRAPKVSFKKPIGSVSVSGHKFVGCPMPCGVQITRLDHINALSRNVEYLASRDATIMGSRNGHAPIFLWYTLNRKGYKGFQKEVQKCLRNAHYLKDCLKGAGISVMLNELSSTVVFERPKDEEFVRRWQLACERNMAHAVVMPNVTIDKLDCFVSDLVQARLDWYKDENVKPPCLAADIGMQNCCCPLHK
ncbi:unnamed protein product [Cuscuta europaea]|uniref:Serine decarboxylase n=1 Tax=Cuscuta europaea TaxID=41803 RepID=A0A9P1E7L0_CUSEU|nr:unnamed protein product [Cuscuta europaea]